MRVSSNKICDLISFFRTELKNVYTVSEIEELTFRVFEYYLKFSRNDMLNKIEDTVNQSDLIKIYDAAKRLAASEPLQYVLGEAYFYKYTFLVNKSVLIPRPETEELVEMIYKKHKGQKIDIIDFGTGSGCIPISLKLLIPTANVSGCDISDDALSVARTNARALNAHVHFFNADMLTLIPSIPCFDVVISNPPYIKRTEGIRLDKNVKDFEPHLALFVEGTDSIIFYKRIIIFCVNKLNKGGVLYFELNPLTAMEVKSFVIMQNVFTDIELHNDLSGNIRFLTAVKA